MKSSKIVRLPLYAQIKDAILQKLSQREWKFDQPLPSESKMADEFGVSVGSIRHAVAELEDAGILIRRQWVLLCAATKTPAYGIDFKNSCARTDVCLFSKATR